MNFSLKHFAAFLACWAGVVLIYYWFMGDLYTSLLIFVGGVFLATVWGILAPLAYRDLEKEDKQ